jgi:hypothetical protein
VISIPVANSATGGVPVAYSWAATTGTISGNGLEASWSRVVQAGQVGAGTVTVTVTDSTGESETFTIDFP